MPKRNGESLFEIGPYWIAHVAGSARLYRFWYDADAGEVRRRSLETENLEAAKVAVAAIVLKEGVGHAREPNDVPLISVLTRYFEEHSDKRPNPSAARRAGDLLLNFMGNDAVRVGELTKCRQGEFMRHLYEQHNHSVAYISRVQSIIAAALNRAVAEDDDDNRSLLARSPKIIVQPRAVAEILNAPEPEPQNWHPDISMLARFIDAIPAHEETRILRFAILTLIFGRPEAVRELSPFQIDERTRLVALNKIGRRQTKKYRPTLPMPDVFWPTLLAWRDAETIVHMRKKPVSVLRKPWGLIRGAAGLPESFVPKSLRHMLATELRRRRVPKEERELWQGHRRLSTNDRYGVHDPEFMTAAKVAVSDVLTELSDACRKPILPPNYRQQTETAHTKGLVSI